VAATAIVTGSMALGKQWELVGSVTSTARASGAIQYRPGVYLPGQSRSEPYPVPNLWRYLGSGAPFEQAVQEWAGQMEQWSEQHMRAVMGDVVRLAQEKMTDWMDA
jgi:hypothetical protein